MAPKKREGRGASSVRRVEKNRQTGMRVGCRSTWKSFRPRRCTSTKVPSRAYCGLLLAAKGPYRG